MRTLEEFAFFERMVDCAGRFRCCNSSTLSFPYLLYQKWRSKEYLNVKQYKASHRQLSCNGIIIIGFVCIMCVLFRTLTLALLLYEEEGSGHYFSCVRGSGFSITMARYHINSKDIGNSINMCL